MPQPAARDFGHDPTSAAIEPLPAWAYVQQGRQWVCRRCTWVPGWGRARREGAAESRALGRSDPSRTWRRAGEAGAAFEEGPTDAARYPRCTPRYQDLALALAGRIEKRNLTRGDLENIITLLGEHDGLYGRRASGQVTC